MEGTNTTQIIARTVRIRTIGFTWRRCLPDRFRWVSSARRSTHAVRLLRPYGEHNGLVPLHLVISFSTGVSTSARLKSSAEQNLGATSVGR
jgi:hypothetical protein